MSGQLLHQWPVKPLSELCEDFKKDIVDGPFGSNLKREHYTEEGVPVLKIQNIKAFEIKLHKMDYVSEKKAEELKRHSFQKGDIIMTKLGNPLGVSAIVEDLDEGIIVADLVRIRAQKINTKFLCYQLNSPKIKAHINSLQKGTTRPRVRITIVRDIPIVVPPMEEQQRIVSILDNALNKVENAKAQAQMNLQGAYDIFTSFLDTIITDTNNDWKDTVLGEEYDVRDGTHDSPKYHEEGHYLLTSKNLKRDGLTYAKAKFISPTDYQQINKRSKVDKGDVLFAMIGTIGNPVVIEEEPDFAIKNVALFKVGKKNGRFLKYLLQSKSNMEKMLCDASGTTQRFVSLRYLRGFPIRLPSDEEQYLIVKKLDELFDNTEQLAKKYTAESKNLDELKQSILQEAFNGTLRIAEGLAGQS